MLTAISIIVFIYLFISAYVYCFQEQLVYNPNYPERELKYSPISQGMEHTDVYFTTADQVKLHGWFVKNDSSELVALICHGNSGNISHRIDTMRMFYELGMSVFIFDYRGFGLSEGHPSEHGTYSDVEAAWQYLMEQGIKPEQVVVKGRSLGGAIASYIAHRHTPLGLIVDSSFASIHKLGQNMFPIFPANILVRYKYPHEEFISQVQCPVLIFHSLNDELIPYTHGKMLYRAVKTPKTFVPLYGGHNNSILLCEGTIKARMREFMDHLKNHEKIHNNAFV